MGRRPEWVRARYGSYGQDGTSEPRIPDDLLGWLTQRYDAVFNDLVQVLITPGRVSAQMIQRSMPISSSAQIG